MCQVLEARMSTVCFVSKKTFYVALSEYLEVGAQ